MAKRALVHFFGSDWHYGLDNNTDPFAEQARECAQLACEYLASKHGRLRTVIIGGDLLDGSAFSAHAPSNLRDVINRQYMETEIVPGRQTLDRLGKVAQNTVFLAGNHCDRIDRFIIRNSHLGPTGDLHKAFDPRTLLSLTSSGKARKNFTWIPFGTSKSHYFIAPRFVALHGWSFSRDAAAVHMTMARGYSVIHGDTHRRQEVTGRHPITKQRIHAMSPGCLGPLDPSYMRGKPNDHSHGFAIIYQSATDPSDWTAYQISIHEGYCVLPDGKQIRA